MFYELRSQRDRNEIIMTGNEHTYQRIAKLAAGDRDRVIYEYTGTEATRYAGRVVSYWLNTEGRRCGIRVTND